MYKVFSDCQLEYDSLIIYFLRFRQAASHPEIMCITPPYEDAWGSGILITQAQTIHKRE